MVAVAALLALALPAQAGAATSVGQTFIPGQPCSSDRTELQTTAPSSQYTVPGPGVITAWSVGSASGSLGEARLKLALPAGGMNFTITRQSARRSPASGTIETFNTREPVQGGELLGLHHTANADCYRLALGYDVGTIPGDQAPGVTAAYAPISGAQLSVSAVLEPDADNDGYGDETQDCAPTDQSRNEDCNPPDSTITKGPKKKTKKKRATFEFTGTEPLRAIARFECALDNTEFIPCTSPVTVRVKKGKHTFSVRAADEFNNIDATPATYSWKVKKKKHRK